MGDASPGDAVRLEMDVNHGRMGVFFGYVLPLFVVLGVLFGLRPHVSRESLAGLAALGSLIPYFGILYLIRGFFARVIQFRATPLEKEGAV